jgi:hypothetical protein
MTDKAAEMNREMCKLLTEKRIQELEADLADEREMKADLRAEVERLKKKPT